jgi:hypothetical protein
VLITIDVDSTLYPANDLFVRVAREHFNVDLPSRPRTWHEYNNHLDFADLSKVFRIAHKESNVSRQVPYEDSVEICQWLADRNHDLFYISDRHPEARNALFFWLRDYGFIPETEDNISSVITSEDKRAWLSLNKPDIVIDDRVRTLVYARYELNALAVGLKHPWNENLDKEIDGIHLFDNWSQIGEFLDSI